jgi:outer membrane protein TolC
MGVKQDNMWSGTLGVMLPVFARSRELPMGAEMDAMARAGEADLREATLDLSQRLRSTHARALAAQRRVGLYADTVGVMQSRALAATWSAYAAGSSDLWRVLEAMHAQYEDELALVRARQDLARTEGELVAILARGDVFGMTLPAPVATTKERTSR